MTGIAAVTRDARRGVPIAVSDSRSDRLVSTVAYGGVCLWILAAPFEGSRPLVHLPGQSISSVEAGLLGVFAAWAAAIAWTRTWPEWRMSPTPLASITGSWIAFLLAVSVAALAASAERANAVHMAGRFGLAFGVYLVTINGITTLARLRTVFIVSAVAGTGVAALAVAEFLGVPSVLGALTAFRPGIAVVGAQVRAAGPFQYPTIASMYLEILFAFVLALVLLAIDAGKSFQAAAAGLALAAIAEGVILTFTRAGLMTIASSMAVVGMWRARRSGFDRGAKVMVGAAAIVVAELLMSHSLESVRLRMTTETQNAWYRASVDAPLDVSLTTGATTIIPVTLTNTGLTTWDSSAEHPYRFAYHWLLADSDRVANFEGLRTTFAEPVLPGSAVTLRATVRAPGQPGQYRLMWDVVQEGRLWFSSEDGAEIVVTRATVTGPSVGFVGSTPLSPLPRNAVRPGRFKLWQAAGRMVLEHPWLGMGPDNFRLLYGGYLGIANADVRVHTNNMYLEVLVGGGLVAGVAFAWLVWRAMTVFATALVHAKGPALGTATAGVVAAGTAIALHGLVDSFLSFTATYVLFAVTLGLAAACDGLTTAHANRV
jgi:O-antigen ligase/polysaccharide polymerase Wzy-like membrane protein